MNRPSPDRSSANSFSPTVSSYLREIRAKLPRAMERDRRTLARRMKDIQRKTRRQGPDERTVRQLKAISERVEASISEKRRRLGGLPEIRFPSQLPITARAEAIIRAIRENQVVIISGDTGSGKSTQIPKICLKAGRGIEGKIACTQPRRIAATTLAARIAEELGEDTGRSVGYKVRFSERTSPRGYIKIMTDGMLLSETRQDPRLHEYDTVIVDEAHERSLNIDFILGIMKTLLPKRRNLKLIITSATIDTEKFSRAFDRAPVIEVSGRRYPVRVEYLPLDPEKELSGETTYVDMAVEAVEMLGNRRASGDILIFMPTEQDIIETCERLEGLNMKGTAVLPLFARLPGVSQRRIFASMKGRKIIVSTNVAETSLTIPGIRYVIDTGLARIPRYLPRTRTTTLAVTPISRSSADQRKGRCGRLENGVCIRLYSREDYEARPEFTDPEILRSNLAEVILRMTALRLGRIDSFPFLDRPSRRSVKDGFDLLTELGAIVQGDKGAALTKKGRLMARMPIDPKISRMILEAREEGCVHEVAVIAAALSIMDPRERPPERAEQADRVHGRFVHPASDFMTLLNLWEYYHRSWEKLKTQNRMRKFCRERFLSFPRMREWHHIHEQISKILEELGISVELSPENLSMEERYNGIHRSILSGYLSNIAVRKEKNIYLAARGREAMIFPGSTLFNRGPEWIVAAEMVKTSRLFARTAARIDPGWLEGLGKELCKRSYSDPHWEKKRGEVRAWEQVSLYGLVIVPRRPVSYGPIDPDLSHDIFVRSALVGGEIDRPLPFLSHNLRLRERLGQMEEKVRRRGMLKGDQEIAEFYSERLPGIYDIRSLQREIKYRGGDGFLRMREEDLVITYPDQAELAQYPDRIRVSPGTLEFSYRFAPGSPDDGVTVRVPAGMASRVSPHHLDWAVPGLFREKITALIKGLPKRYRKPLVPVSRTVDTVVSEMERGSGPLISTLGNFIYNRFGVDIPASQWPVSEIPDHLRMRVAITDSRGREIRAGKDTSILGEYTGTGKPELIKAGPLEKARAQWEREGITTWDFGDLPEAFSLGGGLYAYPGLEAEPGNIRLRLFTKGGEAAAAHREGVKALFMIRFKKDLRFLRKDLRLPERPSMRAVHFGGAKAVEGKMYKHLCDRFFLVNIRTKGEFESRASEILSKLLPEGRLLVERTVRILEAVFDVRQCITRIRGARGAGRWAGPFCTILEGELEGLVPQDFLDRYAPERLDHLPRYLKAMKIRAERGAYDREKDRAKASLVRPFTEALARNLPQISSGASPEKTGKFEELFWMVEEFKVSVFAQELGTEFPVSARRLEKKLRELERMV